MRRKEINELVCQLKLARLDGEELGPIDGALFDYCKACNGPEDRFFEAGFIAGVRWILEEVKE